jgi:hypothetical protein
MNDRELIKNLLRESLIIEADFGEHSIERIGQRIERMGIEDLRDVEKEQIFLNLSKIKELNFPKNQSFAIMLGQFRPNPNSEYFKKMPDGRQYYSVLSDEILSDSTGDQFWVIIRGNKVTTVMLRKSIQTQNLQMNNEKLRVDNSIKNINNYLKRISGGKNKKRK